MSKLAYLGNDVKLFRADACFQSGRAGQGVVSDFGVSSSVGVGPPPSVEGRDDGAGLREAREAEAEEVMWLAFPVTIQTTKWPYWRGGGFIEYYVLNDVKWLCQPI